MANKNSDCSLRAEGEEMDKRSNKIEKIINLISEEYYQDGYVVKEICLPLEWHQRLNADCIKPDKCPDREVLNNISTLEDSGFIKLFSNQSRHLLVIIAPLQSKTIHGVINV